uniref:Ankyrin repeat domain-containing protein n=1 Tax=Parascaris equorum TaxID=6256 RepID=A0A914RQP4_PAREQ
MSWEFTSWLPFVSKMCPSDTYKVCICAITRRWSDETCCDCRKPPFLLVRCADTFARVMAKRDVVIFIAVLSASTLFACLVLVATIQTMESDVAEKLSDYEPTVEAIYSRMTAPVDTTYVDIEKIGYSSRLECYLVSRIASTLERVVAFSFERSRTGGLLSWITSSDRTEVINGHECKVRLYTFPSDRTYADECYFRVYLPIVVFFIKEEMKKTGVDVYCGLTPAQYLDKDYYMGDRDIGRPKQVTRKSNSFKAVLWLCDQYPLDLQVYC